MFIGLLIFIRFIDLILVFLLGYQEVISCFIKDLGLK